MSAAHSAAPTVFVNAKKMDAKGTSSRRTAATPNLMDDKLIVSNLHTMENVPSIGAAVLLNVLLLLALVPLLELEIPCMCRWPGPLPLKQHKDDSPYHGDEVERQVHEVADEGLRGKLDQGFLQ